MKKGRIKKIIRLAVPLSMTAVLLLGCSDKTTNTVSIEPMEAEKADAFSFDFIGGNDVMPIGGYYGPYVTSYNEDGQTPPEYISDEIWKMIKECVINLVSYAPVDYKIYPKEVEKNLKYGEKYGVSVAVLDGAITAMGAEEEISMEELTNRLANFIKFPSFAGVYLIDEPSTSYFHPVDKEQKSRYLEYYAKLGPILNRKIGMFTYANAFPSSLGDKEFERYEQYIREFCSTLQPNYLMFDRYPFDASQEGHINRYFYDMAVVRMVAADNGIPFWTFIQAGSQWNDSKQHFDSVTPYYPDEGQFDWNINVSLAFGAKGINYFTLIQPDYFAYAESTPFDFQRNGLIGAWGNKNQWFYYAKDMAGHIGAIDEVLMNSVSKGVLACGKQAETDLKLTKDYNVLLSGTSWRELKNVDRDALVGCFNYQGRTVLYVVNYSFEKGQKLDLAFQDKYQVTVIQKAETKRFQGDGMTLDMAPGEGVLLMFE